jgi:hypothetical protein
VTSRYIVEYCWWHMSAFLSKEKFDDTIGGYHKL